jgi:hypothetical protein
MKIYVFFAPNFSKSFFILLLIAIFSGTTQAAVDMQPWTLAGSIDAAANINGKSTSLKKQGISEMTIEFSPDYRFNLTGEGTNLTGVWQPKKRDIKMTLDANSANQILQAIKNDLSAQSNLNVSLTLKSIQANALQNKSGNKLQGRILIKAKLNYPGYSTKTGAITLDYRFTGQPAL